VAAECLQAPRCDSPSEILVSKS